MDVLGRSIRTRCKVCFVGVGHSDDDHNCGMGGIAGPGSSALSRFRRRSREVGVNCASVLDQHGCRMVVGSRGRDRTRSLPPLFADPPVSRSHYRIAFRCSCGAIESLCVFQDGRDNDFGRARYTSYSRRQLSQCNSMRGNWTPDVDHRGRDVVPEPNEVLIAGQRVTALDSYENFVC